MYLSIDLTNMRFRHKHEDMEVVCNLAFIELNCRAYYVFPMHDTKVLNDFTNTELNLLYKNTTGREPSTENRLHLKKFILDLMEFIPETNALSYEVEEQAKRTPEGDELLYVKGAMRPGKLQALTEYIRVDTNAEREQSIVSGKVLPKVTPKIPVKTKVKVPASNEREQATAPVPVWLANTLKMQQNKT